MTTGVRKRTKPNIGDVARLAGVSTATVSRALSKPDQLRAETLEVVQHAIEKLGYLAHGSARALAARRTNTIGAIFPSLDQIFATTTFALQKVLADAGYMLLVACNEYDPTKDAKLVRKLIEREVDGLVLVGTIMSPQTVALLNDHALPHVFTWAFDESGRLPVVGFDHRRAAAQVTQHLLDLGHREFGVVATPTRDNLNAQRRLAGVLETLEARGIRLPPVRIVERPFSYEKGGEGFKALMQGDPRPTAIVCLNDVLAIGAMAECRAMGLSIPEDVSITGCEDLEVARMAVPPLTTVRYPTREMGHYAGTFLLETLRGERPLRQRIFPTELVVRGSSGAAPRA
jgi:LacI family transcriptional regulator